MLSLPSAAEPLLMSFSIAFTQPTFQRMLPLAVGAMLALGRRTVTAMLRRAGGLAPGHFSSYHRVFSRAAWSLWPLGRVLAEALFKWLDPNEPIRIIVDDTTAQHRGKHVYGKGCHHDAVRSTHTHVVWRWGHKWVVLAVSVKLPFTARRWALPAGHVQRGVPDLRGACAASPPADSRRGVVHQDRAGLLRCPRHRATALLARNHFETPCSSRGFHKITAPGARSSAGQPRLGGLTSARTAKVELRRAQQTGRLEQAMIAP